MNTQLREAVLSGQVSAAQVVQHHLAGELDMQNHDNSCQGIDMAPDSWQTIRENICDCLFCILAVAACSAVAGYLVGRFGPFLFAYFGS